MGLILGRFRKKKTALEQLEKIDADIKSIEAFRLNTELAQKRIVGHFILVSAGIYILIAIVFYFYFFPATFYDQIFYITPLLLVPFIIWGVKRLLTWYYRRKISRNENKLTTLRSEKRKLLDHVMDTETYKIAKTILEKFAPEQVRKSPTSYELTPYKPATTLNNTPLAIKKLGPTKAGPGPALVSSTIPKTPMNIQLIRNRAMSTPLASIPLNTNNGNNPDQQQQQQQQLIPRQQSAMPSPLPLPREIIPRERSVLDKMVEYLVGDGPSNRFALICKNCQSHNGMALREEFEYFAFRCCYCFHFNPARKLRPSAPKLEFDLPTTPRRRRLSTTSTTSSSEKNSEPDSEVEEREKIPFKLDRDLSNETKSSPPSTNNECGDNVPMEVEEISAQSVLEKTDEEKKTE